MLKYDLSYVGIIWTGFNCLVPFFFCSLPLFLKLAPVEWTFRFYFGKTIMLCIFVLIFDHQSWWNWSWHLQLKILFLGFFKIVLDKSYLQVGLTFCQISFAVENFVSGLHYSSKLPTLPLLRFIFLCANTFMNCFPHCTIVLLIWLILLCLFIVTDSRRGSV